MQLTVLHSRRSRYAPVDIIISIIQVFASPPSAARWLPGPGFAKPPPRPEAPDSVMLRKLYGINLPRFYGNCR